MKENADAEEDYLELVNLSWYPFVNSILSWLG